MRFVMLTQWESTLDAAPKRDDSSAKQGLRALPPGNELPAEKEHSRHRHCNSIRRSDRHQGVVSGYPRSEESVMPNKKQHESQDPFGKVRSRGMEYQNRGEQSEGTMREGVEEFGHQMREQYEAVGGAVASGYHRAEELVATHPTSSVLIGFGLGLGLGLLLTIAMTQPEEPSWKDWRLAESLRHLQERLAQRT
jgi:uncharacterized protein YaiE (UPF0345 family)